MDPAETAGAAGEAAGSSSSRAGDFMYSNGRDGPVDDEEVAGPRAESEDPVDDEETAGPRAESEGPVNDEEVGAPRNRPNE